MTKRTLMRLTFVAVLLCGGLASAAQIAVEVAQTKENGKKWDGGFGSVTNPDLAICISDGERTTCYPSGSEWHSVREPKCRDTFSCIFNVPLSKGKAYTLWIIDVDLEDNDLIGSGIIVTGVSRQMGQAMVIVSDE